MAKVTPTRMASDKQMLEALFQPVSGHGSVRMQFGVEAKNAAEHGFGSAFAALALTNTVHRSMQNSGPNV